MKKIMFNDKFALTQAVLDGRKTMTRRVVNFDRVRTIIPGRTAECCLSFSPYKSGEVVAVAQSYRDAEFPPSYIIDEFHPNIENEAGWANKMYVRADLMPHRIRITDVRVERLQDISNEDCIREGIEEDSPYYWVPVNKSLPNWRKTEEGVSDMYPNDRDGKVYPHFWDSPRKAFVALVDKVCGKGTWKSNPWVYVYGFELIPNVPMDCRLCSVHPAGSSKCGHRVDYPGGTFGCDRYGKLLG